METIFTERIFYSTPTKLPPKFIGEIIKEIEESKQEESCTGGNNKVDKTVRSSKHTWFFWDQWIAGICYNLMISANKDYFHYDLDHFDSQIQATIYEEGDHYDWHTDPLPKDDGKERKLSMSLVLNEDYEGGELELELKPWYTKTKPETGMAVIFPSWIPHRVLPVTKGKRISLVAWMNGPQWK